VFKINFPSKFTIKTDGIGRKVLFNPSDPLPKWSYSFQELEKSIPIAFANSPLLSDNKDNLPILRLL
jgi:hypothetical protein